MKEHKKQSAPESRTIRSKPSVNGESPTTQFMMEYTSTLTNPISSSKMMTRSQAKQTGPQNKYLATYGLTDNRLKTIDSICDSNLKRRILYGDFKPGVRVKIYNDADKGTCKACHKQTSFSKGDVDHIIPVVKHFNDGGYLLSKAERVDWYNDESNLQWLCETCNRSKGGGNEAGYDLEYVFYALAIDGGATVTEDNLSDGTIQMKTKESKSQPASRTIQSKPNRTGIPDNVKAGFESYSGHSFDDVRVHYNSDVPAQFQAHALTIGNEVHIARGQEKHRDHELGHVVQQKNGEVRPDSKVNGMNANVNENMEKAADTIAAGATVQRKAWVISRELNLGMSSSSDSDSSSSRSQHIGRDAGSSHGSSDSSHGASISVGALSSSAGPIISSNESSRSEGSSQEGRSSGSSGSSSPGGSKGSTSRGNLPYKGVTAPADASHLIDIEGNGRPDAPVLDLSQTTDTSGQDTSYAHRLANLKFHHRHILFSEAHKLPTGNSNNIGWGGEEYSESSLSGYQLNQQISNDKDTDERLIDTVYMDKYRKYGRYNIFVRNCQHWVNDVVRSLGNGEAPPREEQGQSDAQEGGQPNAQEDEQLVMPMPQLPQEDGQPIPQPAEEVQEVQ